MSGLRSRHVADLADADRPTRRHCERRDPPAEPAPRMDRGARVTR
jgi:hypothetical protein